MQDCLGAALCLLVLAAVCRRAECRHGAAGEGAGGICGGHAAPDEKDIIVDR